MKKIVLLILFSGVITSGFSQSKKSQRKLNAVISKSYKTYNLNQDPVTIYYKVHVAGGSGKYDFKWRRKGKRFQEKYTNTDMFDIEFKCGENERQESIIYCQIQDIVSKEIITAKVIHPVEFCQNINN